jgi:TetR/AcrR family transcriptional repressor of nem operon
MANRKQSNPLEKPPSRTRLLNAALDLVRARGYAATTVDDICHRAGVTKGSFFHHFKSKDDLALAAVAHWEAKTEDRFAGAPYHEPADPLDRLLGYLDFRAAILTGELADYTCLLGTLIQETYATHPKIRVACERALSAHTAELTRDIEASKRLYAPTAPWSAESVGNFIQAVIQGSFILAKAKQGPEVVQENLEHLRRTLRVLFQPDSYSDPAKAVEFASRPEAPDSPVKKKDRQQPAFHPEPVEEPEAELEPEEEYDSRLSHFVD